MDMQGSTVSKPTRLKDDRDTCWKQVSVEPPPVSAQSKTTSFENLSKIVAGNIGHAYLRKRGDNVRKFCNIVPLERSCWLLPAHMLDDAEYDLEVQVTEKHLLGKNPRQIIGPENWHKIPDTDFAIVSLTSGGDVPNLTRFLPLDSFSAANIPMRSHHKNSEGITTIHSIKPYIDTVLNYGNISQPGFHYAYPEETFKGLCMATLVTRTRQPCIAGFHLAGKTGTNLGGAVSLTQRQVADAIEALERRNVILLHSSGTMCTEKYGVDFAPSPILPAKSPVNWLVDECDLQPQCLVFGSHALGTRTFRSDVRKSIISDAVTKHTGVTRMHGPPRDMNSYRHWQRDLSLMAHPTGDFRPSILARAKADFERKVDKFFSQNKGIQDLIHPYTNDVILAGMDGVGSVDRIQLNTSTGFPLNKQKKLYVTKSDRLVEGITEPLDLDPQFWHEVDRMEEALARGERVYTIFRANLKDEPTKLTKDKVRVFAGCELAFTLLVRRYFLSIVRVIQKHWINFECAVGINAHGADWSMLSEFLIQHGDHRMIAGDYAAYDKRVATEATMSAMDSLVHMAELAGYSKRQLMIMRGIATEICVPVYEYNGILLKLFGSNPSGHPLTVIINNIQNSLYLRYGYYSMHEFDNPPDFDVRVKLMCYGDDNIMGVSESEDKFNHTSVSNELAKVGIVYTMADKEAASIPFLPLDQTSFLKRGFVKDVELGQWLAPIEELSIFKSLHNYMHKRGSIALPETIASDAIKGAMREYFRLGRLKYDEKAEQLTEVAFECGIREFVGRIPTYEEATLDYIERLKESEEALFEAVIFD